jgi:hypothetical protein
MGSKLSWKTRATTSKISVDPEKYRNDNHMRLVLDGFFIRSKMPVLWKLPS